MSPETRSILTDLKGQHNTGHVISYSGTVLVRQTTTKLIVYYHALESAFSCLQQCTLTYWGMFALFISFQFLSAKCWCSVSIHTLIDVASIMFECCYFILFCHYWDGVVFTRFWADHGEAAAAGTDCVTHTFIYSLQTFYWVAPPWYISHHISVDFLYFLPGRILWMCCVGKRFYPLNHLTMSCCHVAYLGKKKYYLWIALVLWIQFSSCFYEFV